MKASHNPRQAQLLRLVPAGRKTCVGSARALGLARLLLLIRTRIRRKGRTHGGSMFKHILVPTDFGEPADHALDVAVELARKFDAKLSLLHVYQVFAPMPYGDGLLFPIDEIAARARARINELANRTKARHPECAAVVQPGAAWERIVDEAKSSGADLIVMGTHGRRGLSRAVIGSVAEKVVRLSPVPVLTLSAKRDAAAHGTPSTSAART
jgi:nucleotide-binding universal stress UspA family protein